MSQKTEMYLLDGVQLIKRTQGNVYLKKIYII